MSTVQENNKRIAKNMLMLYMRMFLLMLIGLITSRYVLKGLGVTDYGIYGVVGGIVSMMGVLNSAMTVATTRYLTFELGKEEKERLKQVFSTCLTIYLLLSAIFFIAAETIGLWFLNTKLIIPSERMNAANWVYQFSIISTISSLLTNPYTAIIVSREKMDIFAYISIIESILKLGIAFIIFIVPFDRLIVYGFLYMFMTIVSTLIYRIYCTHHYEESHYRFYWEKNLFVELVSYSGWNLFGSAAGLFKGEGLNILLNMFFNPAINASRGIANQISSQLSSFFSNFYDAARPQITKYYAKNDLNDMFTLVLRSSKFSFFLILFVSLPVIIEAPFLIRIWLGQLPDYVVSFTRLIVIISAFDAMSAPIMTSAHATGHIRLYQFIVGTITRLNIPISYSALKFLHSGPNSVFVISLLLTIFALFARLVIVRRLIPTFPVVAYIEKIFFKCIGIGVIASIIPVTVHAFLRPSWFISCFNIILTLISAGSVIYFWGLTRNERSVLTLAIKNKLHL